MKRSDLVVGESYYYATGTGWLDRSAYGRWGRAVVVASEPYVEPHGWGGRDHSPRQTNRGPGVLVDLHEWGYDPTRLTAAGKVELKPYRTVVQLGQLRGPWGQTKAEVDAAEHQRLIDAAERQAAADEDAYTRGALVARAVSLGLTGTRHDTYRQEITIVPADLALLLDSYEQDES